MFQAISAVDIGQGPGNAFGGGIYAASCQVGFSNAPTKITLNVVSENGQYQSVFPNVYSTPYHINMNGKTFSGMYLYAYEKNKTAGASTMTLNFVDSSLILDKVFIGLLNRHGNQHRETLVRTGLFTVRCPSCTEGIVTGFASVVRRYLDDIPGGQYFEKGIDGGGYIILGKENFPDTNCEVPKVDYNFTELCTALNAYGIKHELSVFDLNNLYRQEYAGTLREVLNNWAADFSFEFFFDGGTLKALDLRRPIDISAAQSFAANSEFVSTYTIGESLENTYTQSVIARYLKPSTAVEYNNTFHYRQIAQQVGVFDILNGGKCAGRGGDLLLTSIALSRLDDALREAYIANYAITSKDYSVLQALGFIYSSDNSTLYAVDTLTKNQVIAWISANQGTSSVTQAVNPANYVVFVGLFNSDVKEAIASWDKDAAQFMGKYYYFSSSLPPSQFACPISRDAFVYYTFNSEWTTVPSSNTYGGDAVPFASLLRDPSNNTNLVNFRVRNLFAVDDNAWGIEPEIYNASKGANNYDTLKPQIIDYDSLPAPGAMALKVLTETSPQGSFPSPLVSKLQADAIQRGASVAFIAIPILSKFPNAPTISAVSYRTVNNAVFNRLQNRNSNDQTALKCLTYCDIDIVSEICNCGAQFTPIPYFVNLLAPYIQIGHMGAGISHVVFPVDSNYWGFFTHARYYKTTNPPVKSIYGTPPHSPSNTMGVKIVDYDITPDINALIDTNDAVNQYIYSPTNGTIMTAQAYYNALANLNNLVIPTQQSVKITINRTDLTNLGLGLSPVNGLTDMQISLTDGGSQTELTYATRPPVVPKAEAIYVKIKYRLKTK